RGMSGFGCCAREGSAVVTAPRRGHVGDCCSFPGKMRQQAPYLRRGNSGNLAVTAARALSFRTMKPGTAWCLTTSLGLVLTSCSAGHTAQVRLEPLPPLPDPVARHASRIVIQL